MTRFYQLLFFTSCQESSQVAISHLDFTNLKTKPSAGTPETVKYEREASLIILGHARDLASQSSVALQAPHSTAPGWSTKSSTPNFSSGTCECAYIRSSTSQTSPRRRMLGSMSRSSVWMPPALLSEYSPPPEDVRILLCGPRPTSMERRMRDVRAEDPGACKPAGRATA